MKRNIQMPESRIKQLLNRLQEGPTRLRRKAARDLALAAYVEYQAPIVTTLRQALESERDPYTREAIQFALSEIDG